MCAQYDEYYFTDTVLNLSFSELSSPLNIAKRHSPLPTRERDLKKYYSNFLPFILEEARAIIATGLEKVKLYLATTQPKKRKNNHLTPEYLSDATPFKLKLQSRANFPHNEDNPVTLKFKGVIPTEIEHGFTMNVLLLKLPATSKLPERQWISLASETLAPYKDDITAKRTKSSNDYDRGEITAKIMISSDDYDLYEEYFNKDVIWEVHYLGSILSEQRMFDNCLMNVDIPCVREILRANIAQPNIQPNSFVDSEVEHLNQSQKEALYAFFNADEGSVTLLQGPPGTGKTTTLVSLLKCVADQGKRILVSAHSNKGVQVLAQRAYNDLPHVPMMLVGVAGKCPEELRPILLSSWYDNIKANFATHLKNDQIDRLTEQSLSDISENIVSAKESLKKFNLLFSHTLSEDEKEQIYWACDDDPITFHEIEEVQWLINQLRRDITCEDTWQQLRQSQRDLVAKWQRMSKETIETHLLDTAELIFATLIVCGRKSMASMDPVDYLLVDEAGQSVEAATMIPMRFLPDKVLLAGDTKQLPATVISEYLKEDPVGHADTHYQWSLMWRLMEECKQPSLMLDIQYRMHPHICQWPSEKYYNNLLITAPDILPMSPLSTMGITSRPYAIYQVTGYAETHSVSGSVTNHMEAKYVKSIVALIREQNADASIGVITPYAAQKTLIFQTLKQNRLLHALVTVNTVDGFQGDERDVIIMSFARNHTSGFLRDFRRLNVALTRPKYCLIILAHPGLIEHDVGELMRDAHSRNVLFSEEELKFVLSTKRVSAVAVTSGIVSRSLSELAWRGDAKAQYEYHRTFSQHNICKAVIWLRRAAENGCGIAQYELSKFYSKGNVAVKKDTALSLKWLVKSAKNDYKEALVDMAQMFMHQRGNYTFNVEFGLHCCRKAAEKNYVEAIVFLAKCYATGKYVLLHRDTAITYYRRAAELDDIPSMVELTEILNASQHRTEIIYWHRVLVTKHKRYEYSYPLALLLQDTEEEREYLQLAADHRVVEARVKLVHLFTHGNKYQAVDVNQAVLHAKRLADLQHIPGSILLVELLQKHETIEMSQQERERYYKMAADRNHVASQYHYGVKLMETQPDVAYSYLRKAVNAQYSAAYYHFAMLEKQKSKKNAYLYFRKAIEVGEHDRLSKQECVRYQLQFNVDLPLCLTYCEDLYATQDTSVAFMLARMLHTGIAGRVSLQRALDIYVKLVDHMKSQPQTGSSKWAAYYAGVLLSDSKGTLYDKHRARHYFIQCEDRVVEAKVFLACLLLEDNVANNSVEMDEAERLLYEYCGLYPSRQEIELNIWEQHLERIIQSANLTSPVLNKFNKMTRFPRLAVHSGYISEKGLGVPVDAERAFLLYLFSAEANVSDGQWRVGLCYECGCGTLINMDLAKFFYEQAAAQGHQPAQERLLFLSNDTSCLTCAIS